MEQVLLFLSGLSENNNRIWFDKNKKWYQESRDKVLFITEVLINEIRKFDQDIPVMDPRDCLFRIFRDVRFSEDKSPYKINMGSFIAKGGRKSERAGYYFHLEPGACFAGGGIYMPEAEPLKAIRQHIYENPVRFAEILENDQFKKTFPEIYGHKLKSAPKGFPRDFEYIELLKPTSYAFSVQISDEVVTGNNYIGELVKVFGVLSSANAFLNEALDKIS